MTQGTGKPPPLTDDELAATEAAMTSAHASGGHLELHRLSLRLIADLRAARAEVERLREELADVVPAALRRGERLVNTYAPTVAADPVGLSDIAARLGVAAETPKHWNARGLLPAPKWTVSGRPVWEWRDIEKWARKTGRM